MGLNEFAGYVRSRRERPGHRVDGCAFGLEARAFLPGRCVTSLLGLATLGVSAVRETRHHVAHEIAGERRAKRYGAALSQREVFRRTSSLTDRNSRASARLGLVNNLNDGMAWGLFPLVFAATGMRLAQIGVLAAIYPAVWAFAQVLRRRRAFGSHRPQTGSSPAACGCKPSALQFIGFIHALLGLWHGERCCWDLAPPWCTQRCSPP